MQVLKPAKSIIFNSLGNPIDCEFVIVIDDINTIKPESFYIYISTRTARDENGELKIENEGEILIKKSNNSNSPFKEDSYLNCSRLFKIKKDDFNFLVQKNKINYIKTTELDYNITLSIFNQIIKLLQISSPHITLININYSSDENKIEPTCEYIFESHLEQDLKEKPFSNNEIKKYNSEKKNSVSLKNIYWTIKNNIITYEHEKVILPLAIWLKKNHLLDQNWTTKEIIMKHNSLFEKGQAIAARLVDIYDVGFIDYFRFANHKLKINDWEYALKEFNKGMKFEEFQKKNTTDKDEPLFDFHWLKKEYDKYIEQEKKKRETIINSMEMGR